MGSAGTRGAGTSGTGVRRRTNLGRGRLEVEPGNRRRRRAARAGGWGRVPRQRERDGSGRRFGRVFRCLFDLERVGGIDVGVGQRVEGDRRGGRLGDRVREVRRSRNPVAVHRALGQRALDGQDGGRASLRATSATGGSDAVSSASGGSGGGVGTAGAGRQRRRMGHRLTDRDRKGRRTVLVRRGDRRRRRPRDVRLGRRRQRTGVQRANGRGLGRQHGRFAVEIAGDHDRRAERAVYRQWQRRRNGPLLRDSLDEIDGRGAQRLTAGERRRRQRIAGQHRRVQRIRHIERRDGGCIKGHPAARVRRLRTPRGELSSNGGPRTMGGGGSGTGTPPIGVPRGCVVVRLRTEGVWKSPLAIPMGPLRSRGMPGRERRTPSLRLPAWRVVVARGRARRPGWRPGSGP